jgi:hypothetical protein
MVLFVSSLIALMIVIFKINLTYWKAIEHRKAREKRRPCWRWSA